MPPKPLPFFALSVKGGIVKIVVFKQGFDGGFFRFCQGCGRTGKGEALQAACGSVYAERLREVTKTFNGDKVETLSYFLSVENSLQPLYTYTKSRRSPKAIRRSRERARQRQIRNVFSYKFLF